MQTTQKIIIVFLVVAVIAVGILVFMKQQTSTSNTPTNTGNPDTTNTTPTPVQTKLQQLVAQNPGPNATTDQLKTYSAAVFQASVESTTLDVSGCSPIPSVLRTKTDSALTIKNTDSVPHKILNGTALNLDVAANSSKSVSPKLPLGIYAYSCDSKISGIIMVTP